MGIKAFAFYRDGSKASQPLQTAAGKDKKEAKKVGEVVRQYLPSTRNSQTHKFAVAGHEGYLTYSTFEDGRLAEIFIRMSKQGSTLAGLLDAFAISVSIALQYGVPFKALADKFIHSRFEPAGYTENPQVLVATSIVDYIFKYLAFKLVSEDDLFDLGIVHAEKESEIDSHGVGTEKKEKTVPDKKLANGHALAGTVCRKCGGMMIQSGSCHSCLECGDTTGGCF